MTVPTEEIYRTTDHVAVARHFGLKTDSMRKLKNRHVEGRETIWPLYVKAYYFDRLAGVFDAFKPAEGAAEPGGRKEESIPIGVQGLLF